MAGVFGYACCFNQPLDKWDVSKVTDMDQMFYYALHFDQDISNWDVSNVRSHWNFKKDSGLSDEHSPF